MKYLDVILDFIIALYPVALGGYGVIHFKNKGEMTNSLLCLAIMILFFILNKLCEIGKDIRANGKSDRL